MSRVFGHQGDCQTLRRTAWRTHQYKLSTRQVQRHLKGPCGIMRKRAPLKLPEPGHVRKNWLQHQLQEQTCQDGVRTYRYQLRPRHKKRQLHNEHAAQAGMDRGSKKTKCVGPKPHGYCSRGGTSREMIEQGVSSTMWRSAFQPLL